MKQCDTYPGFYGPNVEVICIDLFDDPKDNEAHKYPGDSKPFFKPTNAAIRRHIAAGNGVMIHCMASLSRSSAFVCAYLMEEKGLTLLESLAKIRVRCPSPTPPFLPSLSHTLTPVSRLPSLLPLSLSPITPTLTSHPHPHPSLHHTH